MRVCRCCLLFFLYHPKKTEKGPAHNMLHANTLRSELNAASPRFFSPYEKIYKLDLENGLRGNSRLHNSIRVRAQLCASLTLLYARFISRLSRTRVREDRYNGMEGIHGSTMVLDKKEDCLVCGASQRTIKIDPSSTLADLVKIL